MIIVMLLRSLCVIDEVNLRQETQQFMTLYGQHDSAMGVHL